MEFHEIARKSYLDLEEQIRGLQKSDEDSFDLSMRICQLTKDFLTPLSEKVRHRIEQELNGFGPINDYLDDEFVSEIIINGPQNIFVEKNGHLLKVNDSFFTELTFKNFVDRLCDESHCHASVEYPFADGHIANARFSLVRSEITHGGYHLAIRKHPINNWNLEKLQKAEWCTPSDSYLLKKLIQLRKSFLIIGPTSSGKTSVINALLQEIEKNERLVIIEDTSEIRIPNEKSMKMLTRMDPNGNLMSVDQTHLLKQSLRLRPDRLVLGEIRGNEAKDFLMLLSTGHAGSFGTLHAADPRQALLRLEMLIQAGSNWNLQAIRKLIFLSLEYILVTGRSADGKRKFQGLYRLSSLEENGFLIDSVDDL